MQDTDKTQETPQNHENIKKPEVPKEAPVDFQVEKKVEEEKPIEEIKEIEDKKEELSATAAATTTAQPTATKAPEMEKIESILEEDLEDIYFKMPPAKQAEFSQAGTETASKIVIMLGETKIKIKKILELITKWLAIVPGINKFFLEQEAKIKTDKILELKEEKRDSNENQNKI